MVKILNITEINNLLVSIITLFNIPKDSDWNINFIKYMISQEIWNTSIK